MSAHQPQPAPDAAEHHFKRRKKKRKKRSLRKRLRPLRHAVVARLVHLAVWLARRLSHRAVLSVGRFLGRMAFYVGAGERAKTLRNLELAFGDSLSPAERRQIARQVFESAAMSAGEAINGLDWPDEYINQVIAVEGLEHWRGAHDAGKGVIFVTGHIGNWELGPRVFLCKTGISVGVIVRNANNPALNEMMIRMRETRGIKVFSNDASPLGYLRLLRRGGAIAMLADQDSSRLRGIFVEFFRRPAFTPVGPAFLSRLTGAPIVPGFLMRRRDDPARLELRFYPAIYPDPSLSEEEDQRRLTQAHTSILESEIRANPEQWAWMHERWKTKP